MTNDEERRLKVKDVSARLPYGVIAQHQIYHIVEDYIDTYDLGIEDLIDFVPNAMKVYLRPFSDMTEEEKLELESLGWRVDELDDNKPWAHNGDIKTIIRGVDWLNAHHFDFRGLIEMDLALKAPKGMYKI